MGLGILGLIQWAVSSPKLAQVLQSGPKLADAYPPKTKPNLAAIYGLKLAHIWSFGARTQSNLDDPIGYPSVSRVELFAIARLPN